MLGLIIGAVLFAEDRYAHAQSTRQSIEQMSKSIELRVDRSVLETRKWTIEDRLMEIETKPESKRTDVERAMSEKYKRELETVNRRITVLQR
jgi:23S rRNA-/tRNA-specific pseudouridylate synthase